MEKDMSTLFIFDDKELSAIELIFALADKGIIYLDQKDMETTGIKVKL